MHRTFEEATCHEGHVCGPATVVAVQLVMGVRLCHGELFSERLIYVSRDKYHVRNFIDIMEGKTLPLRKGQLPRFRGLYAAFVAVMRPQDFLDLTTSDYNELQSIKNKSFPYSREKYDDIFQEPNAEGYGRFEIPFLMVHFPSGRIRGHEGRHRAAMVLRDGGKSLPVMIIPYEDDIHTAVMQFVDDKDSWIPGGWDENDRWVDGRPNVTGEERIDFDNDADANSHLVSYLIGKNKAPEGSRTGRSEIVVTRGRGTLKGAPARSDFSDWKMAKWEVDDFPNQLIGQYNRFVSLPKSRMKIGLVKGYQHHFDRKKP